MAFKGVQRQKQQEPKLNKKARQVVAQSKRPERIEDLIKGNPRKFKEGRIAMTLYLTEELKEYLFTAASDSFCSASTYVCSLLHRDKKLQAVLEKEVMAIHKKMAEDERFQVITPIPKGTGSKKRAAQVEEEDEDDYEGGEEYEDEEDEEDEEEEIVEDGEEYEDEDEDEDEEEEIAEDEDEEEDEEPAPRKAKQQKPQQKAVKKRR
jgi:hypothetical protein